MPFKEHFIAMRASFSRHLGAALLLPVFSACASVPIAVGPAHEIFPDTLPSNVCYLRTVRAIRLTGVRLGYNATGTLMAGQFLITAGHNLYDSWRTKLISVQVSCRGRDGAVVTSVVGAERLKQARKVDHYTRRFPTDYAFLRLDETIDVAESIQLSRHADIGNGTHIAVAGFPGGRLEYGTGPVTVPHIVDSTFRYAVETKKGMSGGAVWSTEHGVLSLLGVHVSNGRARMVDDGLVADFERWRNVLQSSQRR